MKSIYLDHAATSPLHPLVLEAMMPCFQEVYGNPSSLHSFGRAAKSAVRQARDKMAEILSCQPRELVFTSGGTESDNTALFGIFFLPITGGAPMSSLRASNTMPCWTPAGSWKQWAAM